MRHLAPLVLALLAGSSATAAAQPSSGTVFISGAAFAAIEKAPTNSGGGLPENDASGTVVGGGLGIGVYLTSHLSARFEWSVTDRLTQSQRLGVFSSVDAAGRATSVVDPRFESTIQTTAGYALLGYHLRARRASIELLGGLGFVDSNAISKYDVRLLSLTGVESEYKSSTYHAAAVVGADVAVKLTDHAAIVPQVRAYALGGGLSVRPGLSVRWTF